MSARWTDRLLSKEHQCRKKKYNNKTTVRRGQGFRSGLEGDVYEALLLMERDGLIRNIRREQSIQLTPSIKHKIDFLVEDCASNSDYGVEAKGATDRDWSLKSRLYKDFGKFRVEIWRDLGGGRVGPSENEEISPGRYQWGEINE